MSNISQVIDNALYCIVIQEKRPLEGMSIEAYEIKQLSNSVAELLGYQKEELIGQSLDRVLAPELEAESLKTSIQEMKIPETGTFQCDLIGKGGEHIAVTVSALLLFSENQVRYIVLLIQKGIKPGQRQDALTMMKVIVEQSANAIVITDPKGRIEYVNPKFSELTGYSALELLGKNPRILQSGTTSPEEYQAIWDMLYTTGEWKGEIKNKKKNGEFYWAYETISAIKDRQGEITHFLAIEEDISQRKHIELALKEGEERFRQMAEMTGEWLWEQDPEGYYIYSSAAVKKIIGLHPEEVIGKHYTELLIQDDSEVITTQTPFYAVINYYRHVSGRRIITESTGLPIEDENGKLIKWRGVDRDITARKHAEEALADSEKRYRLIVESALNAIVIMDSDGKICEWNRHAEQMFGWTHEEVIGRPLDELIIPRRFRKQHRQGLALFLQSGQGPILNTLIEHIGLRRDGSEFPIELSVSPLKLGDSYIFSGFIHDITFRKEREKRLRQGEVSLAIARNELKIAHRIQASLLPSKPMITDSYTVTGLCLPADQVGGDYYDYFMSGADRLDMVIADVSGHSVGPALLMVEMRSALRVQANKLDKPGQTLTVLNDFLFADLNSADYFITLFYMQYATKTRQLTFTNAGHPMPLLLSKGQDQCTQLDTDGLILGVRRNVIFEQKQIVLQRGDMILFYTDGVTEAENSQGQFFGSERVEDLFIQFADLEPRDIIGKILEQLKQFSQTRVFNDDVTLMLFKQH